MPKSFSTNDLAFSEPLVSVIVPFHNPGPVIQRTIESVLNQSYSNIELVLVNDRSTDSSLAIVESFGNDNRVRIENNKYCIGQSGASNYGVDISKGKYVKFLDADDWLNETHIESCVECLEKFEDDGDVFSVAIVSHLIVEGSGDLIENHVLSGFEGDSPMEVFKTLIAGHEMLAGWKWLIPRIAFTIHNVRWDESLTRNKDFVFSSDLLRKCHMVLPVSSAIYYYVRTPHSEGKKSGKDSLVSLIRAHQIGASYWTGMGLENLLDVRLRKVQQYIYQYDPELANSIEEKIQFPNRFVFFGPRHKVFLARVLTWRVVLNIGRMKRWLLQS